MNDEPERSPLYQVAHALDELVFRIEKILVTVAAMVMTLTVFLDICYRSFRSDDSVVAQKLLAVGGWFGVEKSPELLATLRDQVTPALLGLLAFLAGVAVFLSGNARREANDRRPGVLAIAYGLFTLGASYGFIRYILWQPSWVVCMSLIIAGCAAYLFDAFRRQDWLGVAMSVVVGGLGSWLSTKLPQGYIWSQELSLILLAWVAFLGASMATRVREPGATQDKHLSVDALSRIVPEGARQWTRAVGLLATTVFCVYFFLLAWHHVFGETGDYAGGEKRPSTGIPAWIILFSVVVSFAVMSIRLAFRTIDAFINPQPPTQSLDH